MPTDLEHQEKSYTNHLETQISDLQKESREDVAALTDSTVNTSSADSEQDAYTGPINLTQEEQIAFVSLILDPPEPGPCIKEAVRWYRELTGT
jgi:hypothetical protein